jgi:hypothetical protein
MALTTTLTVRILGEILSTLDQGTARASVRLDASQQIADGTGASLADRIFSDTRTLAASANETLDLSGGGLLMPDGSAASFVKVKGVFVKAAAGNVNNVVVGAATAPFLAGMGGTTPTFTIPPGGSMLWLAPVSGWTVTNASNDGLRFANSAGSTTVTYDVIIFGTSA